MSRIRFKSKEPLGLGSRIIGTLFFSVFFAMGALFCVFVGREFYQGIQTRSWPVTECVIIESRVNEDHSRGENPYRFVVRYDYQRGGRTYSSTNWARKNTAFSDYSKAQRLTGRYPVDARATCLVNPADPTIAVLVKPTLWIGFVILFPLVFVAIGLGGMFAMWSSRQPAAAPLEHALSQRALSSDRGKKIGRGVGAGFFSIFLVVGLVATYFVFIKPVMGILAARTWRETPCTIIASNVQRHSGKSTTYSVDILYAYAMNGREFRSNRYGFMTGSSSGYQGKAAIAARYQPGTTAVCFVNPSDPNDAVLERGFTATLWIGAIPFVFVLVGAGGIIGALRAGGRTENDASPYERLPMSRISGSYPGGQTLSAFTGDAAAPRVLKSSSSRIGGVIAIGIFAAIWNGAIFFGFILNSGFFRRGRTDFFDWFGILFMIPFVAIGLFMVGLLVYQILGLFNPKVELTLTPGSPQLGDRVTLSWRLHGRTQVLRGLKIFVEGREEAMYRRGTSTYTDRKPFFKIDAYCSASSMEPATGDAGVVLPADSVPSWKSKNNKIVWAIHVAGDIPRWPDLKEEFVITVRAPQAKVSA